MQKTKRLRQRITFAFLLFGAAITLVLGFSLVMALKSIETSVLDDILYTELAEFQKHVTDSQHINEFYRSKATIVIYTVPLNDSLAIIPEHVRNLPQGIHDVTNNNRDYRILVEDSDSIRYIVQFDDTSIHKRERDFIRLVWICAIVTLIIAFIIGLGVANHVISPIKKLAHQVKSLKNQPGESLDMSEFGDDEVGVLARKLQHYHEQLQQLLIREKEFTSSVSHELRTPVTSISMAAEVLASKTDLSTLEHERIQRIQRAVGEMSELIETFLILSQINDEPAKHNEACEMAPIISKVVEQQRVWLGKKPVQVIVEEHGKLEVAAHPGILSVLVANLVRNAFRYTEQGTITVLFDDKQLTVIDTGIGIDIPTQAQLFKGYIKSNSGNKNRPGLGLTIVQRICERYGWRVSFESKRGHGSQFTVLFTKQ